MRTWVYEALSSTLAMIRRRLLIEGYTEATEILDKLRESIDRGVSDA